MNPRSAIFERMGASFDRAFGNVDAVFTINGEARPGVRAIFRKWRDVDEGEEQGQAVEGTTHLLSVAHSKVPDLVSQRDSVTIFELDALQQRIEPGSTFQIKNHADDARSMLRIYLSGDI
ncbi:hypothetical protein AM571_CH01431 [Rhizobium etli 8C-3]|uniref:Uncharacterized protein n=1 Tax=Rhizobium etli 8C-3 TaxID=538025 RepID=A0A1L5P2F0_RHIET|nr:hypothetical protein [Rhizobium etli]APO74266.1 hypothetical protein AM571_CH01431 [Rhizobium etli 8C-3]